MLKFGEVVINNAFILTKAGFTTAMYINNIIGFKKEKKQTMKTHKNNKNVPKK